MEFIGVGDRTVPELNIFLKDDFLNKPTEILYTQNTKHKTIVHFGVYMVDTICYAGLWLIVIYVIYVFINLFVWLITGKNIFPSKNNPFGSHFFDEDSEENHKHH